MELHIQSKGRAVLLAWAGMAGALLLPFAFWQGAVPGLVLCAVLAALLWWLSAWASGWKLTLLPGGGLAVQYGLVWQSRRALAPGAVIAATRLSTPLLRLAGCRMVLLQTAGGVVVLPCLQRQQAAALCAALCPEATL